MPSKPVRLTPGLQNRMKEAVSGKSVEMAKPHLKTVEKGLVRVHTLEEQIAHIRTVDPYTASPADFETMDKFFGQVNKDLDSWANQLKIPAIDPIKAGILALEKLDRSVRQPLEQLKKAATTWMADYQRGRLEAARETEEKDTQEKQRLLDAASLKMKQALAAQSPQMKAKFTREAAALEAKAIVADEPEETVLEAVGKNTGIRVNLKWDYPMSTDSVIALCRAVIEGKVPAWVIELNYASIDGYFRDHVAEVMEWPGFVVKDDVQIVKKRGG